MADRTGEGPRRSALPLGSKGWHGIVANRFARACRRSFRDSFASAEQIMRQRVSRSIAECASCLSDDVRLPAALLSLRFDRCIGRRAAEAAGRRSRSGPTGELTAILRGTCPGRECPPCPLRVPVGGRTSSPPPEKKTPNFPISAMARPTSVSSARKSPFYRPSYETLRPPGREEKESAEGNSPPPYHKLLQRN